MMLVKGFKRVALLGISIAAGAVIAFAPKTFAFAETNVTSVQGTVYKGTTADVLYLNSNQGIFTVKIDASTDTSKCRLLVPGKAVTVAMYRGDDATMHAQSIVSGKSNSQVSVDSNRSTVSGTVKDTSTEEVLYLDTTGGEMIIKIDPTTDFSGIRFLVAGKKVSVVVSRGSDAYMHAISISDTNSSGSTYTASTAAPVNTTAVSGTPTDKSSGNILYLETSGGTMYLIVDEGADTTNGFMFTPGNKLTAYVYRGSDAVMHASKITGTRSSGASISGSTTTFQGTVGTDSKEDMLYLVTSGGTMKIKLDTTTVLSGAKGLNKGRTVSVSAAIGSDEYWHAVSITAK